VADPAVLARYEAAVAAHEAAARDAAVKAAEARDAEQRRIAARVELDAATDALATESA